MEHLQAGPAPPPASPRGPAGPLRTLLGWRARYMYGLKASGYLSHATLCVSQEVRRTLIEEYSYPADRVFTVQNGVDVNYYRRSGAPRVATRAALGLPEDSEIILYVARLSPIKRIDILIKAVSLLRGHRPSLRCVLVGGGLQEQELKAQAQALGCENTIVFAGHRDDVRPYLEAADVYATSSAREGLPLSLAEAMAYELPCVATDIGGHREVLSAPGTGVLVESGSAEKMATAIEHLLDNPAEARAMGLAARKVVEERFNVERMVEQLMSGILNRR